MLILALKIMKDSRKQVHLKLLLNEDIRMVKPVTNRIRLNIVGSNFII